MGFEQAAHEGGRLPPNPSLTEGPKSRLPPRSLLRHAPALVLFAIVIADAMRSADTDLWAHIFFGRIVLTHHQLWFHAPFSYACPPGPRDWIMHDWLGNLLMALVYNHAGIIGLKLAKFGCVATVMVLLSLGEAETGASLEVQGLVLLIAAIALLPMMEFRTFLADDVCLGALMAGLSRQTYGDGARLWLTIPMFWLWANLHGGFLIGLAAMGVYTMVRGVQCVIEKRDGRGPIKLAALTSGAALATLINPYGLRDWAVILSVVRNRFTLAYVSEFHPMFARMVQLYHEHVPLFPFVFALAIMGALFVTFALSPRADDLALFAIAALMTVAALYAARNAALAVIAAAVPLSRHVGLLVDRRCRTERTAGRQMWLWQGLQGVLAISAIGLAVYTGLLSRRLPDAQARPVGAVAFMRQHHLYGNTLCAFAWADYFIWHQSPQSHIFIESLFEAYYPQTVQYDYLAFERATSRATKVLNSYPHDFILFPTGSPTARFMSKRRAWELIYRDPVSSLFARANSPAAHIAGVPVLRGTAPASLFP